MGTVIAIEHVTLDGVMQAPARPDEDRRDGFEHGGWAATAASDPKLQETLGARMGGSWSLLLGRTTYEDFFGHWPKQPKPNPMADALDNVQKFVVSSTLAEPLPWQHSALLEGDAGDAVAELKEGHDKTLVIFGSGVLVRSLLKRDLIDELVLQIHPLVLSTGRRLFAEGGPPTRLRLCDAVTTESGVVVATYLS